MKSILLSILGLASISQAVNIAPQHANNGGCAGPSQAYDISVGETIEINPPGNCVFNVSKDKGFNMIVCSGSGLSGQCIQLSSLNRVEIEGFFNWQIPFTFVSMNRNGN